MIRNRTDPTLKIPGLPAGRLAIATAASHQQCGSLLTKLSFDSYRDQSLMLFALPKFNFFDQSNATL